MVGADLVCSAGATSFGAGWEGASAGRGGGNGGDAAVDALEACSGKASSAVIMKKSTNTHARDACSLIHRPLISANSSSNLECKAPARQHWGPYLFFSHLCFRLSDRNPQLVFGAIEDQPNPAIASRDFQIPEWNWVVLLADIKVLANGATTYTLALRRKLVRLTVFAVPGTKYFGAA